MEVTSADGAQQPPADRIALTASAELACYPPSSEQSCWSLASFKAPYYEPAARAAVDIVAVIDKSGSMRGAKIELVKKTLLFVIDQCKFAPPTPLVMITA